jgi:uncharacterized protein YbaR (Trm112 family)
MNLSPALLDLLACPIDKRALLYLEDLDLFYNPRLRRSYRIEDGIPTLLAEQAVPVGEDAHVRYLGRAAEADARITLRASFDALLQPAWPMP